jgi:siroheme synthase
MRAWFRLKGGDPAIFGRLDEEIASLRAAGVACEIIPGVTAVSAAAADLGLPLTCRGIARRLVMVTPRVGERETAGDWSEGLTPTDTLAIYMGRRQAVRVQARLLAIGFAQTTPVAVVEGASLSQCRRQRGTLADLPELARATGTGPVIMLVGEVLARTAAARTTVPVRHADAPQAALATRGAHPAAC